MSTNLETLADKLQPLLSAKMSLNEQAMRLLESSNTNEAFDGSAEPIVYMSDNRMPVMVEFSSAIIYIVFIALILALLFILPGVRRTKLTSLLGLITLLTVGASILLAIQGSYWLTGSIQIIGVPYSALDSETVTGKLEVNIGLSSTNVTLIGTLGPIKIGQQQQQQQQLEQQIKNVNYNERFQWDQPEKMANEHMDALRKGLPYPILTVTEFFSQDSDGFNWTRQLRQAGFYSSLALYTALASWCLMTVIMCVLPIYLPYMMQITGGLMMCSVWIYTLLIQSPKSFAFQLQTGNYIEFSFGYTYVTTFIAGAMSMFAGVLLFAMQATNPHKQFTIMDSEQYVADQKALYNIDLVTSSSSSQKIGKPAKLISALNKISLVNNVKETTDQEKKTHSVVIPIADIEENFKTVSMKLPYQ